MRVVLDVFAQIFGTLWAHKLRSFLTMFGIAWGVGSLLLLVGLGEGFRSGNKRNLSEYGENIMMLFPGRPRVGSFILLNGHRFEVIGTLVGVGRGDDNSTNTRAYIPFKVMRSDFPLKGEESHDAISALNFRPRVADDHLIAQAEVRR